MRIKLLITAVLLLVPCVSRAAVDCADANGFAIEDAAGTTPLTNSYTLAGGLSDTIGFQTVGHRRGGGTATITAQTWNGSSTTAVTTAQYTDPAGGRMFYILSPASGTVSATFSAAPLADSLAGFVCSGVNQSTPFHDETQSTGSGTTASVTVSNVSVSDVVVACVTKDGNEAMTGDGSLVQIAQASSPGESNIGCWYQPGSAGGSVSVSWTGTQQWTIHATAVSPTATTDVSGDAIWFY